MYDVYHNNKYDVFSCQQLLEKAEARERERQKAEEKKVSILTHRIFVMQIYNAYNALYVYIICKCAFLTASGIFS